MSKESQNKFYNASMFVNLKDIEKVKKSKADDNNKLSNEDDDEEK